MDKYAAIAVAQARRTTVDAIREAHYNRFPTNLAPDGKVWELLVRSTRSIVASSDLAPILALAEWEAWNEPGNLALALVDDPR